MCEFLNAAAFFNRHLLFVPGVILIRQGIELVMVTCHSQAQLIQSWSKLPALQS